MPDGSAKGDIPRWDLTPIYENFDATSYVDDKAELKDLATQLQTAAADGEMRRSDPEGWLTKVVRLANRATDLAENLGSYCYARYSTETTNQQAVNELGKIEELFVPLTSAQVEINNGLAEIGKEKLDELAESSDLAPYTFFFEESLEFQKHQMTSAEENLAADLSRTGADAWGRLQETISSTLSTEWEPGVAKTVVQLRAMAFDPSRDVRQKAYKKELALWKSAEIPIAAALNGVKGTSVTLAKRRGFTPGVQKAVMQSRINDQTLDSLLTAMEESLPTFRRYLKAKAKILGVEKLAFYDLFAPVGSAEARWSYQEGADFIVKHFSEFSEDLGDLAKRAFAENWIDAEPREGKVGGAYCTGMPIAKVSRILANFDGSFDAVSTLAHELGHAYHGEVLKDEPALRSEYPMTLAETASIFCQTIIFNKALETTPDADKPAVIEGFVQDACQVIVDILSRYKFETAVFERRDDGELSPSEFSSLMIDAQKATYGDGLDPDALHQYMWAVKGHYYRAGLDFYNFPYAFGLLFGVALYAQYEAAPDGFPERYRRLLGLTGSANAMDVCSEAGFNIQTPEFWRGGIDVVKRYVDQFEAFA